MPVPVNHVDTRSKSIEASKPQKSTCEYQRYSCSIVRLTTHLLLGTPETLSVSTSQPTKETTPAKKIKVLFYIYKKKKKKTRKLRTQSLPTLATPKYDHHATQTGHNAAFVNENDTESEGKLKCLDFVEVAGECGVVFITGLYEFSKNNAGLFKPVFQSVEDAIVGIIGPVCDKHHLVPFQLLQFLDRKADELIHEIDWQNAPLPTLVKQVLDKAIEVVRELAVEVHQTGLIDATVSAAKKGYSKYKPMAKDLVYKYEPVVEDYALWAWWWFNQVPIVSHIARRMLSNATFWAERYNQMLDLTARRGYPLVDYMPVVPVERISQVLTEVADGDVNVTERDAMASTY